MLRCSDCQYTRFLKSNKKPFEGRRWWRCGRCGNLELGYRPFVRQAPREIYIDIETSLNIGYFYDLKVNGYLNPDLIKRDWFIISWSAEWMNCYGHKNFSACVTPKEAREGRDARIVKPLRDLIDEADIVWGHNYKRFDKKKINTRILLNGIEKPEEYKVVDTLQVARSQFAFASNKLDFINKRLGNGQKDAVDLHDWILCMEGDKKTLEKVLRYNIKDVKNGISMTKKIREWVVPFPNVAKITR